MKVCTKCNVEKDITRFRAGKGYKNNIRSECRDCENIAKREKWPNRKIDLDKEKLKVIKRRNYWARTDIKDRKNKRNIERRKTDELFSCKDKIRGCINQSIRRMGYTKGTKTETILGCSWLEFKFYIEGKFKDGMSWYNKGEWHLDHIIPISIAKNEEEVYKLNHYSNFQPLWAIENLRKSNKIIK